MATAKSFQIKLSGSWEDYKPDEDKILKRAYLAGFPNAKYTMRGQHLEVDFKAMQQKNLKTGKAREIRPPYKWAKPPAAPIVPSGPTFCVKVPKGSQGQTIHVPHPKAKDKMVAVQVPKTAKDGQAMLVPLPDLATEKPMDVPVDVPAPYPAAAAGVPTPEPAKEKKGWSTGGKIAAGTAAVVGIGGLAVGGALLGEHIAEEGWDATMADLGDVAGDVGDGIVDGAEAVGDWVGDAAEDVGDFVMDLF